MVGEHEIMLSMFEEEFRKEYSSYKRMLEVIRNQEKRMKQTCLRLGQLAVKERLWHDLSELAGQEGVIAQVTLVRNDNSLVFIKDPGKSIMELYSEEKYLSKGYLFLVTY